MARLSYRLLIGVSLLACATAYTQPANATRLESHRSNTSTNDKEKAIAVAEQLKKQGNYAEAAAMYNQALQQSPDSMPLMLELASLYRKIGQPQQALALMTEAQKKDPDNAEVLTQLGYSLVDSGQPEQAIQVFEQLSAISRNNPAAYNGKGVAFDKAGNHVVAQDMYRHALKLKPGAVNIQNNLAMSMILNDQVDEAIELLEPLSEEHSDNKTIRQNLALAYGIKGDKQKALSLNMKDLTPEQAKENLRFYTDYAKQRQSNKKTAAKRSAPPPVSAYDEELKQAEAQKISNQDANVKKMAEAEAAAAKAAEEKKKAEAAAAKAAEDKKLTEQKAAEEKKLEEENKVAQQKAVEEKKLVEQKAAEVKKAEAETAAAKAAEDKKLAEQKAAEEKKLAEQKAAEAKKLEEEKKIAQQKAAEEKKLAEQKAAEMKKAEAETAAAKAAEEKKQLDIKAINARKLAEAEAAAEKAAEEKRLREAATGKLEDASPSSGSSSGSKKKSPYPTMRGQWSTEIE
jgi:Flp pilus assembly protein TadD